MQLHVVKYMLYTHICLYIGFFVLTNVPRQRQLVIHAFRNFKNITVGYNLWDDNRSSHVGNVM